MQLAERRTGASGLRLSVEVEGLLQKKFPLPPVRRELRYDADTGQWMSTSDDNRVLRSIQAMAEAPLLGAADHDLHGTRLVLPDAADHEALPAGMIFAGKSSLLLGLREPGAASLLSALREPASNKKGVGLIDLARTNVAWQLAETSVPLGNLQRWSVVEELEAALIQQLCGAACRMLETGIDLSILSQHGALLRCADALGLSGKDLPEVEASLDRTFLRNRLIVRLRKAVPDIGETLAQWNDELAGDLDLAVIDAYEDLRQHLETSGIEAFEEVDMSRPSEKWREALERSREPPLLPMFRPFILPESSWSALIKPWYSELSEDDLVELLFSCHVDAFQRPGLRWLGRSELRAMLQLWLSPKAMVQTEDWRDHLAKALSDVQISRAVRYVALRSKLALRDLPEGIVA